MLLAYVMVVEGVVGSYSVIGKLQGELNEGIRTGLAFLDQSLSEGVVHDKVKVNALGKVTCHC